jgi:hypothetical protein
MDFENEFKENSIEYLANIIVGLYTNPKIRDFKISINRGIGGKNNKANCSDKKKHLATMGKLIGLFINDEYSSVQGKDSIESILKKTIQSNIPVHVETTKNGLMFNELKKGIDILISYTNNLRANNKDNKLDDEIKKKEDELQILQKKYDECMEKGEFTVSIDYKAYAEKALMLLSDATSDLRERKNNGVRVLTKTEQRAKKLHEMVNEKLGIKIDRRQRWEIEKECEMYEYKKPENVESEDNDSSLKKNNFNEKPKENYKNFVDCHDASNSYNKNYNYENNYRHNNDYRQENSNYRQNNSNYRQNNNNYRQDNGNYRQNNNNYRQNNNNYRQNNNNFVDNNKSYGHNKNDDYVPPYMKKEQFNKQEKDNINSFPSLDCNIQNEKKNIGSWGKSLNLEKLKENTKEKVTDIPKNNTKIKKDSKNSNSDSDNNNWNMNDD